MLRKCALCLAVLLVFLPLPAPQALAARVSVPEEQSDPQALAALQAFNDELRAEWMDLRAEWMDIQGEQIEFLALNQERSAVRIHKRPSRWVANDPRRVSQGNSLSWMVDLSDSATGKEKDILPKLPASGVEAAIERAVATWASNPCLSKAELAKRTDDGSDPDLFDNYLAGQGGPYGFPGADVVHGGWLPSESFDALSPGAGRTVIALSVTFIFVGPDGTPTDIDQDGYFDIAANEVYYNDAFPWALAGEIGADVETVALHEVGHALGLGHVASPPDAVMNPVYAGPRRELMPLDRAALCALWASKKK